jgi:hypothetical protein
MVGLLLMRFGLDRRGRSLRAALAMAVMASLFLGLVATCPCPAAAAASADPHDCCAEDGPVIGPSDCCPEAESAASVSPAAVPAPPAHSPAIASERHVVLSSPRAAAVLAPGVVALPPHVLRI